MRVFSTTEVPAATTGLPVSSWAGNVANWRTMSRIVLPTIDELFMFSTMVVHARGRVTNDVGYNVGVGYHLWMYDANGSETFKQRKNWRKISPSNGDNVNPQRHHMPLHQSAVFDMRSIVNPDYRPVVAFQADAHSTAAKKGNKLKVDNLGLLIVELH